MKLKTGIIGCGKVGDFHAKAYAQLENSEFTAVCDANLERAKAFAERYNVHAYSDIAEMIQKEHLDVVSVCTPHPIHCDPAVTAAENGCNVLIEKPLASSLADCDRIIEAGDKNHVTIGTMVQRRFYRPCMRIHEAIEAGKIGKPVLGMVTMLGWRDKSCVRSIEAADHIVRAVDEDNAGFVFDSYNIHLNGHCNDFSAIKNVQSEKIFAVHLMSADDVPESEMGQDKRCFAGTGVVDTDSFLQTLKCCGYDGMVSVETFRPEYWAKTPEWVIENAYRTTREALERNGCL